MTMLRVAKRVSHSTGAALIVSPARVTYEPCALLSLRNIGQVWLSIRCMWCSAPSALTGKNPAQGTPWDRRWQREV